ncbi:saccharopine dehydrogenase [Aphanothece hegewaldii CCALA 016]|uniref:Saccharopine dehydrogenase n=1 Tax=Aphanothece hegewaldii CCALA 016 TaxID=2107694 RepID=A0A2T1LQH6_9CHRO|nr:saccharopine dehydrogenase NADP-binding domain-containing protein [Aphanothece hegewaldii]PSF28022.1 saccharopine dehydrogenase [Aphanothece hegewaldii CCALA 016]
MSNRPYDVILYGASGFVGQQTVQYFARHTRFDEVRWAIAGRNRQKLEKVKSEVGAAVDILVADSRDQTAIDTLVSQTRVLLNTAGPFALYGDGIVDACVRFGTHYVDITGETPWVKSLIDRYHEPAATNGTRIIPFCGFDSVPSDLGTYSVVRHLQQELGIACTKVKGYFQANGGFNGGTLASGINLYETGQMKEVSDPFLLKPPQEHSHQEIRLNQDLVFPQYDADIETWVGPFFMSPINTRVVRRSCALFEQWGISYGTDFNYQEYFKFDPPLAWLKATGITAGMALFNGAMQQKSLRHFLKSIFPQPGSGPSKKTMNEGWFCCELLGFGEDGQKVQGLIYDVGDPGNRATVKFLCESALSLALQENELPGGSERGGILTPATGLGDVLAQRLRQTGMHIEVKMI